MNDLLASLRHRIAGLMRRAGVVSMAPRVAGDLPRVQVVVMAGEVKDGVPTLMPYGFAARPLPESALGQAETLALAVAPNHYMALPPADRRFAPPDLAPGEAAVYDDQGQVIHLTRTGIVISSPHNIIVKTDGVLRLEGDGVEIHGRTYVQTDVHGKGQRETWIGGTDYHTDSYVDGVGLTTSTEHGLDQPDVPSNHPDES